MTSRARSHPTWLFVRSRVEKAGLVSLVVIALVTVGLSAEFFPVPFNSYGAVVHGLPLLSLLWGLPTMLMITAASPELEGRARRVVLLRIGWALTLLAASSVLASLAVLTSGAGDPAVAARNAVIAVGLVLLTSALVDQATSWTPLVGVFALSLFWGVDYGDVVFDWALPLHPIRAPGAGVLALGLAVAGTVGYALRDSRRASR